MLRGAAATLVVAHHVPQYLAGRTSFPVARFEHGAAGVDIFFVISGFVMYCTTAHQEWHWYDFALKRLARILPMYWLTTFSLAMVVWVAPFLFSQFDVSAEAFTRSMLFLPVYNQQGYIRPVVGVGWTLYFELLFYLLVAMFLALGTRLASGWAAASLALTACTCAVLQLPHLYTPLQVVSPIVIEFGTGVLLAHAALHAQTEAMNPLVRRGLSVALLIAGAWLIAQHPFNDLGWDRLLCWGTGGLAVVAGCLLLEPELDAAPARTWLDVMGDASYSLYLIHVPTFSVFWKLIPGPLREFRLVVWLLLLAGPVAAAVFVHRYVERRLARWTAKIPAAGMDIAYAQQAQRSTQQGPA